MSRPQRTVGHYELVAELGRGATGVVHRAARDGELYALKIIHDRVARNAESRLQFRREAAAIAQLRHPGLVDVVEIGEEQGVLYLVMGLVEGENLRDRLERGPLPEAQVVRLGLQVSDALQEVHRHGLVHRDIKPNNLVMSVGAQTRLIDFGLVAVEDEEQRVGGTLRYAPPEQLGLIPRAVGPSSDLYALGVTLFECLTGVLPLDDVHNHEVLHLLATTKAPSVLTIRPETNPALAHIIDRLLEKDPDDRYQTAMGLHQDLRRLKELEGRLGRGETLALQTAPLPQQRAHALIGRDWELTNLRRAWGRARSGGCVFISVSGGAGSGKSRLIEELLGTLDDALVLRSKCQEHDRSPLQPIRELAEALATRVEREGHAAGGMAQRIADALGDDVAMLAAVSPRLRRLLPTGAEPRPLDPAAAQLRFYRAIATTLAVVSTAERPVAILLDDIQWLDDASQQVLGYLAGLQSAHHLLVLAAHREMLTDAVSRYHDMTSARSLAPVRLDPLDDETFEALVTDRLGGRRPESQLLASIRSATGGNPFAVIEYLRALVQSGHLHPRADGWHMDPAQLDALALPEDVFGLVLQRLATLDDASVELLRTISVGGGRIDGELLQRVVGLDEGAFRDAARATEDAGLISQVEGGAYTFHHDRIREAVLADLSEDAMRDAHQRMADALSESDTSARTLYARARHLGAGHVDRDPVRVATANLRAGLTALQEHAYPDAYQMLELAHTVSDGGHQLGSQRVELLIALGQAGAMTGHLDEAFSRLEEALPLARTQHERVELSYLLTLTYASQGRNDDGLRQLLATFEEAGQPLPARRWMQALTLLWAAVVGALLYWTGTARPTTEADAKQRKVLSRLNYAGTMLSMFDGDTFGMVQFIVRDFRNVQRLPDCAEKAIATTVYGAVIGTFQLRRLMLHHTRVGVEMATELGDRAAVAVCRSYEACGHRWAGDYDEAERLQVRALTLLARDVPGSWYTAMMICEHAYSLMHTLKVAEAHRHIQAYLPDLLRTNNRMFVYNTLAVDYAARRVLGDNAGAIRLWAELEADWGELKQTGYVQLAKLQSRLEEFIDRREVGAEVDGLVDALGSCVGEDYYSIYARMQLGYARVEALERATPEEASRRRGLVRSSILQTTVRAMAPVYSCHPLVWRAALARLDGKPARARALLDKAAALARRADNPRARFTIALERAKVAVDSDPHEVLLYARHAFEIARGHGWRNQARQVQRDFDLASGSESMRPSSVSTTTTSRSARFADALLEVSLASARTLQPMEHASRALEAVVRVFGAERALFYLVDETTGEPTLMARAGTGAETASSTVIAEVLSTGRAKIVAGDDEGKVLGSDSIVTQGLRSIMAAPLQLRERTIGVVYLDNRLAKGIFTEGDVGQLITLANHIAIAVETARVARLERERLDLGRDLALVGAVQTLALPTSTTLDRGDLQVAAAYHPTTQCSGDWWWLEEHDNGSITLWLGDVSGHGAGAAMITSAVSGAFHAVREMAPDAEPDKVLETLHAAIQHLGGDFYVSMSALRVEPDRSMRFWNAGGPACFVQRAEGFEVVGEPGSLIGSPTPAFVVGCSQTTLQPGDRVLCCTDGLLEQTNAKGRAIGVRRAGRMFVSMKSSPVAEAVPALVGRVLEWAGSDDPDDDLTFAMVQVF